MAVTCVNCNGMFRGRSRKIPCVCGCDRVVHLGCVPGLAKNAAALRKKGGALVGHSCSTRIVGIRFFWVPTLRS